jgi:RNA polymerase sigma factor (sigma-70 family)
LLSYLRTVAGAWREDPRGDADLLARFAQGGDESAFRVLVWRHGPLVWRTCRHLLGDTPDAEDAFQAAFLALARKAGRFPVESLAGWLHRVAWQAALDARAAARRRRGLEQRLRAAAKPDAAEDVGRGELYSVLDEELTGLPERLRVPLVLRYLEGKTLEDVARILGCSRRDLGRRLERAEGILRQRLERRGLTVGAVALGVWLAGSNGSAAVPARLVDTTARAAVASRTGALTGGAAEAARAVLRSVPAEGAVLRKSWCLALACVCSLGASLAAWQAPPKRSDAAEPPAAPAPDAGSPADAPRGTFPAGTDGFGDPLPAGALARLGTIRFRQGANHIAFLADGKSFVAAAGIGVRDSIGVWDLANGKELRRLEGYPDAVFRGFSPGSNLVAFQREFRDGLRLWDAATGKEKPAAATLPWAVAVGACPGGKLVALWTDNKGGFRLLDIETGAVRAEGLLDRPDAAVDTFAWSPDDKAVALANTRELKDDFVVRVWDLSTKRVTRTLRGPTSRVQRLVYSLDGSVLVALCMCAGGKGGDGKAFVWDAATGKERGRFESRYDAPLAASPDGKRLAISPDLNTLVLRDLAGGKEVRPDLGPDWGLQHNGAAFTPDGKMLLVGGSGGQLHASGGAIRCFDTATGREIVAAADVREMIQNVAVSPDGRLLATVDRGGRFRLWDATTARPVRNLSDTDRLSSIPFSFTNMAFTRGGRQLVAIQLVPGRRSQAPEGMVRIWDVAGGGPARQFPLPTGSFAWKSVLSPDGKLLPAGCVLRDGVWGGGQIVETEGGTAVARLDAGDEMMCTAFSPDGRYLATAGRSLAVWDRATWKRLRVFGEDGNKDRFDSVAFSPDGRRLVTAQHDKGLRLWDAATGEQVWQGTRMEKDREGGPCFDVAFSPDGRTLATAEIDGRAHLWEAATGQEVYQLAGRQDGGITGVAFAGGPRRLVSQCADGTVIVWDLTRHVLAQRKGGAAPSGGELRPLCDELASADAARAYRAVHLLTAAPEGAVRLLEERLRPDLGRVKGLLKDLDSETFAVRQRAVDGLRDLGFATAGELRHALAGSHSAEFRRQARELLAPIPNSARGQLLAVAVLEYIDNRQSRRLLEALAGGEPGAELTIEAKAALGRLGPGSH